MGRTPTEPKPLPNGDGAAEVPQTPAAPDGDRSAEDAVERDHPIG